jgi:hypothetical protein
MSAFGGKGDPRDPDGSLVGLRTEGLTSFEAHCGIETSAGALRRRIGAAWNNIRTTSRSIARSAVFAAAAKPAGFTPADFSSIAWRPARASQLNAKTSKLEHRSTRPVPVTARNHADAKS